MTTLQYFQGDDNSTLNSAYQMYADQSYPFKKEFQRKLTEKFEASPQNFDFISSSQHCRMVINNQVEELTKRKIKGLIPEGIHTQRLIFQRKFLPICLQRDFLQFYFRFRQGCSIFSLKENPVQ